jgi:hypothetical protein
MKMILNQKKRIQELESALQFENDVKEKKVENLEPELPLK